MMKTVSFGSSGLKLDLVKPVAGEENGWLLCYVHGGLWVSRDKSEYRGWADRFTREGFTVALVNYRLSPAVRHPKHTEDVAQALECIHELCPQLRVLFVGHSCGAHIGGLLYRDPARYGLTPGASPRAWVGVEGIYDLPLFAADFPEFVTDLEVTWTADMAVWVSPSTCVQPDSEPAPVAGDWLVVHADEDAWVNRAQAERWIQVLRAMGQTGIIESDYSSVHGAHFEPVLAVGKTSDDEGGAGEPLVQAILRFHGRLVKA